MGIAAGAGCRGGTAATTGAWTGLSSGNQVLSVSSNSIELFRVVFADSAAGAGKGMLLTTVDAMFMFALESTATATVPCPESEDVATFGTKTRARTDAAVSPIAATDKSLMESSRPRGRECRTRHGGQRSSGRFACGKEAPHKRHFNSGTMALFLNG
jgi:hypothetical protein